MNAWDDLKRILAEEIEKGGELDPCPFCKRPRSQRSDYVRCANCGINWLAGEALDKEPRIQRLQAFMADMSRTAPKKDVKKEEGKDGKEARA